MEEELITKPSITRLARRSGIKSMSEECVETIRKKACDKLREVLCGIRVVNSERQTKTVMVDDVYDALRMLGYNVTESSVLGTTNGMHKSSKAREKTEEEPK